MVAISALWRVASWVHPFDPARGLPWFLAFGDPIPPMLTLYVPGIVETVAVLLIVFLLLKRVLAWLRAGALEVPGTFTLMPAVLAGIGLASWAAVFVLIESPGDWVWKGQTAFWLMQRMQLAVPLAFFVTEIPSLLRRKVAAPPGRASLPGKTTGRRTKSVFERPAAPPRWSWLLYAVVWFAVSTWILRRFGGLGLYDSSRSPLECLFDFGVAAIPGGLVVALIKIFIDPILMGIAQKRSKVDLAEELLDSVALTAAAAAGEGVLSAVGDGVEGGSGGGSSGGGFSGGGGSSGGGGASGSA